MKCNDIQLIMLIGLYINENLFKGDNNVHVTHRTAHNNPSSYLYTVQFASLSMAL